MTTMTYQQDRQRRKETVTTRRALVVDVVVEVYVAVVDVVEKEEGA